MIKLTKKFIFELQQNPQTILSTLSEDDISTIIQKANDMYYNKGTPLFFDNLYDIIENYLKKINPDNPIFKKIGTKIIGTKKTKLPFYMGSLDKIKNEKDIIKFITDYSKDYIISDKLDGNSALLDLSKKMLYTRGDGKVGQNISNLLPFIKGIPNNNNNIVVRGEMIISKADFEKVKDKGANARNMVAGILNAKDANLQLAKYIQFVAYEVIIPELIPDKQMKFLEENGFITVYNEKKTELTINNLSDLLIKRRKDSPYEIDGLVISHNKIYPRTEGNPTHAFAFKSLLTMEKVEVLVTNVEWNLSKDGYLIPIVNFDPIQLAGVTIKKATGFNAKFIVDNKIGPGSKIAIIRSGDVIPHITDIITESNPQLPDEDYEWTETGVDIKIKNNSDELILKNIQYFFKTIEVVGLSDGNIAKIFNTGFKTIKDILDISEKKLLSVDGFKEKMAKKIFDSIQISKEKLDCIKIMNASNVFGRGFGLKKLELITNNIPNIINKNYIPNINELILIKGIEKKTAEVFIEKLPLYFIFLKDNGLMNCNKNIIIQDQKSIKFQDMKFVFTGFRNDDLEKYIKENGGNVLPTITKQTTYLIYKDEGDNTETGKIKKATEMNIPTISFSEFLFKFKN